MEEIEVLILISFFVFGMLGVVVYYFARFFIFKNDTAKKKEPKAIPVEGLSEALLKSKQSIWSKGGSDESEVGSLEEFEESLYMADLGPQTVAHLIEKVKQRSSDAFEIDKVKTLFKEEMNEIFEDDNSEGFINNAVDWENKSPYVISIVGVNGAGKTTTIGKIAHLFSRRGKKVMVAAGDTFRAAAESQLEVWAERSQTLIFKAQNETKDPGAVAFQAYEKAKKEGVDILIIDTAGRLHTQQNLMNELAKVGKVLKKHDKLAPHAVWMVVDSNTGMNAFHQAKAFHEALGLTGVIMTKVDGSAKAGTAIGIRHSLEIPILMLGVGENMEDLKVFKADEFIKSLV